MGRRYMTTCLEHIFRNRKVRVRLPNQKMERVNLERNVDFSDK